MHAHSPLQPGPRDFLLLILGAALVVCCGCSSLLRVPSEGLTSLSRFATGEAAKEKKELAKAAADDFNTALETPLLGDYISVQGNTLVPLRGVGLVVNLNGTGGNPPPSSLQSALRQEMARRNIPNPSRILAGRDTALVVVTAYLPANARKGQRFDTRIALPPNTNATSLKGGYLLATRLFEESEVRGHGVRKGNEYATAEGPVLTAFGTSSGDSGARGLLSRGSIPGGSVSTSDRNLEIVLRKRYQSIRKSRQIADAITARFQRYDRFGRLEPQAVAKTNALIELRPHPTYRNHFPRFHQVVRHIPLAENEVARRLRMETLAEQLLDPSTSALAAVQLEAIGDDAKPFLRTGLDSELSDVRFFAAEALAYLQDSSGVKELQTAASDQPAFRVYALAALSIVDNAKAVLALRELMNAESLEARYGAVRALTEMNDNDRALNSVRFENRFVMRQIDSSGVPAVHLTRRRTPEVTIFRMDQELLLPAVLNAGHKIRVLGQDGDDTVTVSRYRVGEDTVRRVCSRRLVDIIRTAGELGAAYPDIVQFMIEAERQDNLQGELGIDRLPQGGRAYLPQMGGEDSASGSQRKLGTTARTPGMFDRLDDEPSAETAETLDLTTLRKKTESISDDSSADTKSDTKSDTDKSGDDDAASPVDSDSPEPAESSAADESTADSVEQSEDTSFDDDSDDSDSSGGLLQRFLKDPFAQHSF